MCAKGLSNVCAKGLSNVCAKDLSNVCAKDLSNVLELHTAAGSIDGSSGGSQRRQCCPLPGSPCTAVGFLRRCLNTSSFRHLRCNRVRPPRQREVGDRSLPSLVGSYYRPEN